MPRDEPSSYSWNIAPFHWKLVRILNQKVKGFSLKWEFSYFPDYQMILPIIQLEKILFLISSFAALKQDKFFSTKISLMYLRDIGEKFLQRHRKVPFQLALMRSPIKTQNTYFQLFLLISRLPMWFQEMTFCHVLWGVTIEVGINFAYYLKVHYFQNQFFS